MGLLSCAVKFLLLKPFGLAAAATAFSRARLLLATGLLLFTAGLLLFVGPAATMITSDSPPGSRSRASPQKLQKEMAFKRDFRISQFQRELKLQLVANSSSHRSALRPARQVAAPAEGSKKKKWDVVLERRRKQHAQAFGARNQAAAEKAL